jgi:carboxymethylenebutenolidase
MRRVTITCVFLVALLALATGCLGGGDTDPEGANETVSGEANGTVTDDGSGTEASYEQEPHMGCQPGEIDKNGTCTVAFSGSNAEIFGVENLSSVTATNTSLGGTPGYLARPAGDGEYPAVVMVHEWWGLNDNIRHMADVVAANGYAVFAIDLYGGEVATNASRAAELSGRVRNNPDEAVRKLSNATEALRGAQYTTDDVASLGWCFGGGWSLQLSLSETELNGTVIYYGTLTTNATELRKIDGPVLGVFGSEDEVVGIRNVREFNRTLDGLGVENEVRVYEGAEHAFANPSGESFRPKATRDAWDRTLTFLNETLG